MADASGFRRRNAELEGYVYLPRMIDKARATLAGTAGTYQFGCPLDHTCMARLGVTPEVVLDAIRRHEDDEGVLGALREHGIPPADEVRFDAEEVEEELVSGVYLRVRPRAALDELEPRPGDRVLAVESGAARISFGDRQMRVVRAGEVVRIPERPAHRIESVGSEELELSWLDYPGE